MRNRLHFESNILRAMVQKQVDKWRYIHNINAEYGQVEQESSVNGYWAIRVE